MSSTTLPLASSPSSSQSNGQTSPRVEMVNAAKQFLTNPRVRQTPVGEQKEFLRGKGLTEAEIEAAFKQIGSTNQAIPSSFHAGAHHNIPPQPGQPIYQNGGGSQSNVVLELAKGALLVGTMGFMVYRFVRSWLLPQMFGVADPAEERMQRMEEQISRMGDANRAMADSVAQTLATVTEQNEQISRTLLLMQGQTHQNGRDHPDRAILTELGIVKSLLLNQNQFAPIPPSALNGFLPNGPSTSMNSMANNAKIPAWQLAANANGNGTNSTTANGHRRNGRGMAGTNGAEGEEEGNEKEEDGEEEDGQLDRTNGSQV